MKDELLQRYKLLESEMIKLGKDQEMFELINQNRDVFDSVFNVIFKKINKNDFYAVYQPHIKKEKCTGAEALFRLKINDVFINPLAVFTMASFYEVEDEITLRVLDNICFHINEMRKSVSKNIRISYNVNPKLFNREFCDKILEILEKNHTPAKNIGIELTEVSSLKNINADDMMYLKDKGIKMYCDDFGSGYATEEVLNLPFDVIKFAGEKVSNIDKDETKKEFLEKAVKECKMRGMETLAENVETEKEFKMSNIIGIDTIQGYYYSKPLLYVDFLEKYETKKL